MLETVTKDAASDVESFQDSGASPPLNLVYDCSRILHAEASVGNLVAALRTCNLAREKLRKRSFCDSAKDFCGNGSTDPIIRMLDRRLQDAKKTDTYRKLASEEFKGFDGASYEVRCTTLGSVELARRSLAVAGQDGCRS